MAYVTDTDVQTTLAAMLKRADLNSIEGYWTALITQCNAAGYNEVRGALLNRGFTLAQIDAWDRREEFNRDLALWWVGVKGEAYFSDAEKQMLAKLDRREELETVAVVASGALQSPDSTSGGYGYGTLDTTDDTFTRDTVW